MSPLQQILDDCPICNFHSRSYAEMYCPDHVPVWEALEEHEDEVATLNGELGNSMEREANKKERLTTIQSYLPTLCDNLQHIADAAGIPLEITTNNE